MSTPDRSIPIPRLSPIRARPLPENPSVQRLRDEAREWQQRIRAGDQTAAQWLAAFQPDPGDPAGVQPETARSSTADLADLPLSTVHTALAQAYNFASWPRLIAHVELVNARTWNFQPPEGPVTQAEQFLRLACLNWTEDDPARWQAARDMLAADPMLTRSHAGAAAAATDLPALRRILGLDAGSAAAAAGPFGWSPLMYLTYARHQSDVAERDVLEGVELLLAHGADPNDGRFFRGLPTPFTVLTGVFGSRSAEHPAHPHERALARMLLSVGADPNDGQALYNRMFTDDDSHLELLFEFGLGQPTVGPWHRSLGATLDSPEVMVANQFHWAISHGQVDRVRLLLAHGITTDRPLAASWSPTIAPVTPLALALLAGQTQVAGVLRAAGAAEPGLTATQRVIAGVMSGDPRRLTAATPDDIAHARAERPGLAVWATGSDNAAALALAVGQGWDVNALGRSDSPVDQQWHTALHEAAGSGQVSLVRSLLDLGADPYVLDRRFHSTPLGWAEHFGHLDVVALLSPLTGPAPDEPAGTTPAPKRAD